MTALDQTMEAPGPTRHYDWRPGTRYPLDPQMVGERLDHLTQTNGRLTPNLVVADAQPADAPLHAVFEWNDIRAGDAYRLWQARQLIAAVVIEVIPRPAAEPVEYRAFVNVGTDATQRYVPTLEALTDVAIRGELLHRALRELRGWQQRYHDLHELADVFAAADRVQEEYDHA